MVFMFTVTLIALGTLVAEHENTVIRVIAAFLFVLAIVLIVEAVRAFGRGRVTDEETADEGRIIPAGGKVC
jgi:hypothetical protein